MRVVLSHNQVSLLLEIDNKGRCTECLPDAQSMPERSAWVLTLTATSSNDTRAALCPHPALNDMMNTAPRVVLGYVYNSVNSI